MRPDPHTEYARLNLGAAEALRSLAAASELPYDEVRQMAADNRLWLAARVAHERRIRSQNIQRLMYLQAVKDGPKTSR